MTSFVWIEYTKIWIGWFPNHWNPLESSFSLRWIIFQNNFKKTVDSIISTKYKISLLVHPKVISESFRQWLKRKYKICGC